MPISQTVEEKVDVFFKKYPQRTYKKGKIIIGKEVSEPKSIYYIEKGYVGQTKKSDQPPVILNIFKKGSFFPLIFAIGDFKNSFDFEALSEMVVREAPVEKVIEFVKSDSEVLYSFTSRLSRGVGGLLNHMETMMAKEAQQQIIDTLVVYAKRFGVKQGKYFRIDLQMTHKNLAAVLGLTRETVSRELKELIKKELIVRKGKYFYITLSN